MKRERRHELQHNELAQWLIDTWQQIQPYWKPLVLVVLLAILIGVLTRTLLVARWTQSASAWNDLYAVLSSDKPADFEKVAAAHPGTMAGHWATLLAADLRLAEACALVFLNKAAASQELRKAVDGYLAVREANPPEPLKQRTLWGLARAYEALSGTRQAQGEMDKALALYEELVASAPDGPYAAMASRRLAQLKRTDVKTFYDEFARFDPAAPSGEQPPVPSGRAQPLSFGQESLSEGGTVPDFSDLLNRTAPSAQAEPQGPAASPTPSMPELSRALSAPPPSGPVSPTPSAATPAPESPAPETAAPASPAPATPQPPATPAEPATPTAPTPQAETPAPQAEGPVAPTDASPMPPSPSSPPESVPAAPVAPAEPPVPAPSAPGVAPVAPPESPAPQPQEPAQSTEPAPASAPEAPAESNPR